jgi:hypothetical protein
MSGEPPTSSVLVAALRRLPFSFWWPILAGVVAGVAQRVAFSGAPGHTYAPMVGAFIYLSPVVVGAVTVFVAERKERRTWKYYAGASFLASMLYIVGTLLVMIEGLICAALIAPLFGLLGIVGGLIMGLVCRVTNWPRQTLMGLGVLPFLLAPLEEGVPLPARVQAVERTVVVSATPEEIWRQIMHADGIKPEEVERAWIFRIGVPLPLTGTTHGAVRRVTMGKRVYFDEVITDSTENRYVRWTYRFYEDSFPPHALDDHVAIGGHYFDVVDTAYTLTPVGEQTKVAVRVQYRVSTRFNWYAEPVAQFLLGNMAEVNLDFYRTRSEVVNRKSPQ